MIFVSAGHHALKQGACFEGFCEHEEALIWQSLICNHLGMRAMAVPPGVLKKKVEFINERAIARDLAIEIHFNSAVNADGERVGQGSETLYEPGNDLGKHWATIIQNHLKEFCQPDRGIKEGYYRMDKNNGPDFFLARPKCTALIIEPDFIHRRHFIQKNRDKACQALAAALFLVEE